MILNSSTGGGGSNGGGFVAQATAPEDTKLLWIDTSNNNIIKFYNGTAWTPTGAVFS
jgi:hypothetical protein